MATFYLDHSQYYAFTQCPWRWYETYVTQRAPIHEGFRDDALCIGSLVHSGLENFYRTGEATPTKEALTENNPSKEALFMVHLLLDQYMQNYQPDPTAKAHLVEEPVLRPLPNKATLLAKIDSYFYVDEDTPIDTGWNGETAILSKGWWIKEHKTKSSYLKLPAYIKAWQANMQADFQLLALEHKVGPVQGLLVNVLEKPNIYQPKRKCKGCGVLQPFNAFGIEPSGKYKCQLCNTTQTLAPLKPPTNTPTAKFYRFPVVRTPQRLQRSLQEIVQIANSMLYLLTHGMEALPPNRPNCVARGQTCQYFELHNTIDGEIPRSHPNFGPIDAYAYMNLKKET